jgi:hypothetical protein
LTPRRRHEHTPATNPGHSHAPHDRERAPLRRRLEPAHTHKRHALVAGTHEPAPALFAPPSSKAPSFSAVRHKHGPDTGALVEGARWEARALPCSSCLALDTRTRFHLASATSAPSRCTTHSSGRFTRTRARTPRPSTPSLEGLGLAHASTSTARPRRTRSAWAGLDASRAPAPTPFLAATGNAERGHAVASHHEDGPVHSPSTATPSCTGIATQQCSTFTRSPRTTRTASEFPLSLPSNAWRALAAP